jgi:predicted nucleotidyltransferase
MKYGLSLNNLDKIVDIFKQFPEVEAALLYGSRAKGSYKQSSDIDISLKGKKLNLSSLSRINNMLDDLMLPYKFDISIYHQIYNLDLLDHIKRVGNTLYQSQNVS